MTDSRKSVFSSPLDLHNIRITDDFWIRQTELVRTVVIPYQWEMLNDRVEGAAPSYCIHNFRCAAHLMKEKRENKDFKEPVFTYRGFEVLPEDPENPKDDEFYGFLFQDSDLYKWIEAVGYSLISHPDSELEALADGAIDLVASAQHDSGYLDTYYIINGMDKIFTNLRDNHELYCFGHLCEAAVSYYKATGKDKLLRCACRFADMIDDYFGPDKCNGYPGHEIAEMALIRLYEVTGCERYLKLAAFFIDERGKQPYYFDKEHEVPKGAPLIRYHYHQAHIPVREQAEPVGHAVRAVYLYSGMADMARITGDEELLAACRRIWSGIVNEKLYITGGIGGTHIGESFSYPYDLPNDTAYAETCASIGLIFFAGRMLRICPLPSFTDVMELALYNTVLSGMALDGRSFFYVNPLEVSPLACMRDERKFHVKPVRQKWFGCACCPPNISRLLSSLAAYAYTESDDTLYMHLYIGADITKHVGGVDVRVVTAYDAEIGKLSAAFHMAESEELTFAVRLPSWCSDVKVPDITGKDVTVRNGYMYISGFYTDGDTVELSVPASPMIIEADKRVREDERCVAVMRGPVCYCIEEADNGKELHNLYIEEDVELREETAEICGQAVTVIKANGYRACNTGEDKVFSGLYHKYKGSKFKETELTFIPYHMWANRGEGEMRVFVNVL